MTRKKRRAVVIVGGLAMLGVAMALVLSALQTQVTFFMSPTDIAKNAPKLGTRFRLGGLVAEGSVHKQADATTLFTVTDGSASLPVSYKGLLPDLFSEGKGVVAEGRWAPPVCSRPTPSLRNTMKITCLQKWRLR